MQHRRRWPWFALLGMGLGVPALACGGRVIADGTQTGSPPASTGTTTGSVHGGTGTVSATASGTPTPTTSGTPSATPAPTGSSSSSSSVPCEAYTVWFYSCPPIAGTSGCPYAVPMGGNPADGWITSKTQSQAPGCQQDIISPAYTGCQSLSQCVCKANGTWVASDGSTCS
jgi:hypothetical protein